MEHADGDAGYAHARIDKTLADAGLGGMVSATEGLWSRAALFAGYARRVHSAHSCRLASCENMRAVAGPIQARKPRGLD